MSIHGRTLCVVPGNHIVVRAGDIVLMIFGEPGGSLDQLVATVHELAHAPDPGLMLSRRMAAIVTQHEPGALPPFCAVAPTSAGAAVVAHGAAEIIVETVDGVQVLDGRASATLVDRVFAGELGMIAGRPAGETLPPVDPRFQLHAGVIHAGGAVLVPTTTMVPGTDMASDAVAEPEMSATPVVEPAVEPVAEPMAEPVVEPVVEPVAEPVVEPVAEPTAEPVIEAGASLAAPPPPPPPPPPPAAPATVPVDAIVAEPEPPIPDSEAQGGAFVSVNLLELGGDDEPHEPLPIAGQGHDHEPMPDASVAQVDGVHCVRNHFNNPNSKYCSVCGISMLQQTLRLQKGPRPPLGVFVYDDGAAFSADADYVIGRQPDSDERVARGEARPMIVTDPQRSTSRVHAEIRLSGWDVTVVDRGSANGTWVLRAGASEWQRLAAGTPAVVPTGARVRVGQRHFVFESHHVV